MNVMYYKNVSYSWIIFAKKNVLDFYLVKKILDFDYIFFLKNLSLKDLVELKELDLSLRAVGAEGQGEGPQKYRLRKAGMGWVEETAHADI